MDARVVRTINGIGWWFVGLSLAIVFLYVWGVFSRAGIPDSPDAAITANTPQVWLVTGAWYIYGGILATLLIGVGLIYYARKKQKSI